MAFDVNQARQSGYTDDEILQHLTQTRSFDISNAQKSGYSKSEIIDYLSKTPSPAQQQTVPKDTNPNNALFQYNPQTDTGVTAGLKSAGNLIPSAVNTVKGVASAVLHPIDTVTNLGKIGVGAVEKLIPGKQASETSFDSAINYFKDRYGSLDAITKTAVEDPFGYATDVLSILSGGSSLVKGASKLAKAGEVAKTGEIASQASKASIVTKASTGVANKLQESIMSLTPVQKSNLGTKLSNAVDYITSRKILGTASRQLSVVEKDVLKFEDDLAPVIKEASKTIPSNTASVISDLETLKNNVRSSNPTYDFGNSPIDRAVKSIRNTPDEASYLKRIDQEIKSLKNRQVDLFDQYQRKRSYSSGKMKDGYFQPADVAEKAIGDIYYKSVSDALKNSGLKVRNLSLEDFNSLYSKALSARDVLELSRLRPGILAKAITIGGGALLGNVFTPSGGVVGGIAGAFNSPAQKVVQGGLNVGKSVLSAGLKAGEASIPNAVVPTASVTNNVSGIEDYLKSLGL